MLIILTVIYSQNEFFRPNLYMGDIYISALEILALALVGAWLIKDEVKEERKASFAKESLTTDLPAVLRINLVAHILLLAFTGGIWMFIWIFHTTEYLNCVEDEDYRSPVSAVLLCLFIPFYTIYWIYKSAQRIDRLAAEKGVSSELSTICLILAFLVGIIPPILMHEKLNTLAATGNTQTVTTPVTAAPNNIDELRSYKALLDEGVITQEEFDAKKKQLLGL